MLVDRMDNRQPAIRSRSGSISSSIKLGRRHDASPLAETPDHARSHDIDEII
jgi:hypothetical protein